MIEKEKNTSKKEKKSEEKNGAEQKQGKFHSFGDQVERFATKTAESIKKAIDKALESRNTVLTIRVNDESNKRLNMLVECGLFKSRSESAAFLIEEGIKRQKSLFEKISSKMQEMEKIKSDLHEIVESEINKRKEPESN